MKVWVPGFPEHKQWREIIIYPLLSRVNGKSKLYIYLQLELDIYLFFLEIVFFVEKSTSSRKKFHRPAEQISHRIKAR